MRASRTAAALLAACLAELALGAAAAPVMSLGGRRQGAAGTALHQMARVTPDGGGADADRTMTGSHSHRALLDAAPLQPGLLAAVYPGQYGTLPIPSTWQPASYSVVSGINFGTTGNNPSAPLPALAKGHTTTFSVRISGFVVLPGTQGAQLQWGLESDDGSMLTIGGSPAVTINNGGNHGSKLVKATAQMAGGSHPFTLDYFQNGGYSTLNLYVSVNGGPSGPVDPSWLWHSPSPQQSPSPASPSPPPPPKKSPPPPPPPPPPSPSPPPPPQPPQRSVGGSQTPAAQRLAAVKSGVAPMNGANLGSWLVLEQYMVPELYATVSGSPYGERQLMQAAASQGLIDTMRAAIVDHRNTWITEDDFEIMSSAGINAVRVPVGYWVLATSQDNADGFVEGGAACLDDAMTWGEQYGIGILLELHAANGSQNGYDHSAPVKSGARSWDSSSQPTPSYPQQSLDVIAALVQRYAAAPALLGFGLLNEPTVSNLGMLQTYYKNAYALIRPACPACFVAISPRVNEEDSSPKASATPSSWLTFMAAPAYSKVILDIHKYETGFNGYGGSSFSTAQQYIAFANGTMLTRLGSLIQTSKASGGVAPVIGEWGLAGPPFNCGSGPADDASAQLVSAFYNAQKQAYLQPGSAGWFIWSYKMADGGIWSFEQCYNSGYLAYADL